MGVVMSIFNSYINSLFHFGNREPDYQLLTKKNDDMGREEAEAWIRNNPLDLAITECRSHYFEIDTCARKVINDLKTFPIVSSNLDLVKKHLFELAKQHPLLKQYLIDRLSKCKTDLKADRRVVVELLNDLICVYPNYASAAPSNLPPKDK